MHMTSREFWTVFHGMLVGAVFLLAFAGGMAELWSLRPAGGTAEGRSSRVRRLMWGLWSMALMAWMTVISGTYIVYPWYRAKNVEPPSPRTNLLANPDTAAWHTFGMEWKEHVAWLAPILATAVAMAVMYYREQLVSRPELRKALMVVYVLAFAAAAVAGVFGAFINKIAPIH